MIFGQRNDMSGVPGFGLGQGQMPLVAAPTMGQPQNIAPPQSFVWGDAGARMTPEEIARRRAIAQAQGKSDYSPVSNWAQGLGRVVDGLLAGMETHKLNKAATANSEHSAAITQALLGGDGDAAAAAMVDPTLSSDVQGLAKMQWERAHPKPVNNDTAADLALIEGRLGRGAGDSYLQTKADPIVQIPLPGGKTYMGPRSGLAAVLGGGDPASTAGAPPTTLPPDFDFRTGGPGAAQPRAGFR